ncbi:surface-adhesin E family protein [Streptococcus pyogenes]|uniref:surface-adhesin E family protein n=1 Tax=Streptococcus pyogenes TaxID=1314 RepID=UPI003DA0A5F3
MFLGNSDWIELIARRSIAVWFAAAIVGTPVLGQSQPWTLVGETGLHMLFADFTTMTTNGATRQAWMLTSAAVPSAPGAPSLKSLREFDCKGGRYRNLQVIRYDSTMGRGNVTSMDKAPTPWLTAIPGGAAEHALRNICKR